MIMKNIIIIHHDHYHAPQFKEPLNMLLLISAVISLLLGQFDDAVSISAVYYYYFSYSYYYYYYFYYY